MLSNSTSMSSIGGDTEHDDPGPAVESKRDGRVVVKKMVVGDKAVVVQKSESAFFSDARKLGKSERHRRIHHAIVVLLCVAGIPSHVADLEVWRNAWNAADPSYTPATRALLEEQQIVGEAEHVQNLQIEHLKTEQNITVSCDGGTSRGRQAFWTLHMSTEDGKVYLMAVRQGTSESHTAVWIKTFVLTVSVSTLYLIIVLLLILFTYRSSIKLDELDCVQLSVTALETHVCSVNY